MLALLLLAGCSGGSDEPASPKEWTSALCTALTPLVEQGTSLQTTLAASAQKISTDPVAVRDDFAKALGELAGTFRAGADAAEDAGPPDVARGPELQRGVLDGLRGAVTVFSDARERVEGAGTTAASVGAVLGQVGKDIRTGFEDFGTSFDALDAEPAIAKAGEGNPDCKALNNS